MKYEAAHSALENELIKLQKILRLEIGTKASNAISVPIVVHTDTHHGTTTMHSPGDQYTKSRTVHHECTQNLSAASPHSHSIGSIYSIRGGERRSTDLN